MKAKLILPITLLAGVCGCDNVGRDAGTAKPNIIFIMADDLGWGDVGFNGNPHIKTPNLDSLASEGIVFDRFYSGAAVCSPTRGSCLTGRNPYRYGIYLANIGSLKNEEITIPEILKENGYVTGHFGKWHLGTLSDSLPDGRRGGLDKEHYSPPWDNGFDVCFSNEQAVATWDPMKDQFTEYPTRYWTGYRQFETRNLEGCNSRIIMDRVIPFINDAQKQNKPFFAAVWFHTPHSPVLAGPEYLNKYSSFTTNEQHYYGTITAMDDQVGRLYNELKMMGIDKNTLLIFTSDNGPAGAGSFISENGMVPGGRNQGVTGGFRARKGVLYEGGVRVPGFFAWPGKIPEGIRTDFPAVTSDLFPTILGILGIEMPDRAYDGIDIMQAMRGEIKVRDSYIGFQTPYQVSLVTQQYKLISPDRDKGVFELYDLLSDKYEENNIAGQNPELVNELKRKLDDWIESCRKSEEGIDYKNVSE